MFANIVLGSRLRGRCGSFYRITPLYRRIASPWPRIFALLADKKIDPLIARTFPLLEARSALALLATGGVEGKILLQDAAS